MSRAMGKTFVPSGRNRRDTAILLVGTAAEHGLPDSAVFATASGFYISDDLAALLDDAGYDVDMPAINDGVETGPVSGNADPDEFLSSEEEFYDPADYTVEEVKATVTEADDIEFATGVRDAEQDGKDRSTLVEWLTEFINNNTSEEE